MSLRTSLIGQTMSHMSGVRAIMKDIEDTLASSASNEPPINLSPGNPVILPEVEDMWRRAATKLIGEERFGQVICRYGSTRGYEPFIDAVVNWFNDKHGWNINARNVLITPGSQQLYFLLTNAFCGPAADGSIRHLLMPLVPEYAGYEGTMVAGKHIRSTKPLIEKSNNHRFKYKVDVDQLEVTRDTGAILFSRPCNPTGNVLTDAEVTEVLRRAAEFDVPVIADTAYGPPFPDVVFTDMSLVRSPNMVYCFSLSKAGLPGERIGITIADEGIINVLESFQSYASLHSSRFGQAIAAEAINSGELAHLSRTVIRPYYRAKMGVFEKALERYMPDVPWHLHIAEGALFAWLWFEDLPGTDRAIYDELKKDRVFVVPGSYFFPGIDPDWPHRNQCVRVSLTASEADLEAGAAALAKVVGRMYGV